MTTKVLVVDDELDTLNLLKTLLEISGFEAVTTLNSVDAMTLAEIEKPDVALLDIMMPKLDGFELCKMMRRHPATKHLPIIFVTAYNALDLEERRQEAGADHVIHKPIDIDRLIEVVQETRTERSNDGASSTDDEKTPATMASSSQPDTASTPEAKPVNGASPPEAKATQETKPVNGKDEKDS